MRGGRVLAERVVVLIALLLITGGVVAVALTSAWRDRAFGLTIVVGAACLLAIPRWPVRGVGLVVAIVGLVGLATPF